MALTLDEIKGRCVVQDGHWLWRGAVSSDKRPRIWAYDLNLGKMTAQRGLRSAWQMHTGLPIPEGYRIYGTCREPLCLNPDHGECGTSKQWGRHMTNSGANKSVAHKIARKLNGKRQQKLTDEQCRMILTSGDTGRVLAVTYGVSRTLISKVRRLRQGSDNPFSGLMR